MVCAVRDSPDEPVRRALLDAATGPIHPAAREVLLAAIEQGWADPQRRYAEARAARRLLDQAREVLAAGLLVRPEEVSFTLGGPQALRLGLAGLRYAARRRGARVLASAVEHSAVLLAAADAGNAWYAASTARTDQADAAERPATGAAPAGGGALVAPADLATLAPVDRWGRVDLDAWAQAAVTPGLAVAALQAANGEVGTRQPLAAARELTRAHGIPLLVDATATLGRDAPPTDYDVLAGDARSWGGPTGLGVLVVPARTRWRSAAGDPGVEFGRTQDEPLVPLALAAAQAWQDTAAVREADAAAARALVDRIRAVAAALPDTEVVGDPVDRLPHVTTFSCLFVDGEAIVDELDRRGFAVASGSACTSATLQPSHVLAAMGVLSHGNVRVTLPLAAVAPDRAEAVERFCAVLPEAVAAVRAHLAPR